MGFNWNMWRISEMRLEKIKWNFINRNLSEYWHNWEIHNWFQRQLDIIMRAISFLTHINPFNMTKETFEALWPVRVCHTPRIRNPRQSVAHTGGNVNTLVGQARELSTAQPIYHYHKEKTTRGVTPQTLDTRLPRLEDRYRLNEEHCLWKGV